jgi:hypothetical protein
MKNANWFTRLMAATAFWEYRLSMNVSMLMSDVRRRFSTKMGHARRRGEIRVRSRVVGVMGWTE